MSAYTTAVLADNPSFYWRLGESSGTTAADASPNSRNGTYAGSGITYSATGALGGGGDSDTAITTDGIAGAISSLATLDLSTATAITIEFWLKVSSFPNGDQLAMESSTNHNSNPGSFMVDPNENSSGKFALALHAASADNSVKFTRPTTGVFHHYAIIMRTGIAGAGGFDAYVDKNIQSLTLGLSNSVSAFGNFTIYVASRAATSLFLAATLDEIAIYPTGLSAARISAHYDAAIQAAPAGIPGAFGIATFGRKFGRAFGGSFRGQP